MARRVRRKICMISCKFKNSYVSVQLAKSAFDERSGPVYRFRQLPIVAAFEIPGNRGNVHAEPPGGWRKRLTAEECPNGLPLFLGDLEHQGVVQAVDQVDAIVEAFVAGRKSRQHVEFEEPACLDTFDGAARQFKRLAGELIDRRLNAAGNAADADSDAQRQRPERGPQIQNQCGERRQLCGNGLKFVPGGNGIRQPDELLAQMLFRCGREPLSQQSAHVPAGARGYDVSNQYRVDSASHKAILTGFYRLYESVQEAMPVRFCTTTINCTITCKRGNVKARIRRGFSIARAAPKDGSGWRAE